MSLTPVRGYQDDAARIGRALLASPEFGLAESTLAEEVLRVADPEPDGPAQIVVGMPADVAVATALLGFLDAIESNVPGTIDDVDTEFLHDLRVAVRRTRSLVKLAGDVLPSRTAARFTPRLKWLGDLTTPTRDLDVYLLQLDELRGRLVGGDPADLDAFAEHLRRERGAAHRALVRGLRSQRFARLSTSWRSVLTDVVESGQAAPPVQQLVAEWVHHVHRRVVKRAQTITPDSPAEHVHSLRKRCKELRYILEVARPLCAENEYRAVIKTLKRLQDILGEFQDGEVQSAALRTFAQQMLDRSPPPPAATLLAMGELSAHFAVRQREARHELTDALPRFLGAKPRQRIEGMLP